MFGNKIWLAFGGYTQHCMLMPPCFTTLTSRAFSVNQLHQKTKQVDQLHLLVNRNTFSDSSKVFCITFGLDETTDKILWQHPFQVKKCKQLYKKAYDPSDITSLPKVKVQFPNKTSRILCRFNSTLVYKICTFVQKSEATEAAIEQLLKLKYASDRVSMFPMN